MEPHEGVEPSCSRLEGGGASVAHVRHLSKQHRLFHETIWRLRRELNSLHKTFVASSPIRGLGAETGDASRSRTSRNHLRTVALVPPSYAPKLHLSHSNVCISIQPFVKSDSEMKSLLVRVGGVKSSQYLDDGRHI